MRSFSIDIILCSFHTPEVSSAFSCFKYTGLEDFPQAKKVLPLIYWQYLLLSFFCHDPAYPIPSFLSGCIFSGADIFFKCLPDHLFIPAVCVHLHDNRTGRTSVYRAALLPAARLIYLKICFSNLSFSLSGIHPVICSWQTRLLL